MSAHRVVLEEPTRLVERVERHQRASALRDIVAAPAAPDTRQETRLAAAAARQDLMETVVMEAILLVWPAEAAVAAAALAVVAVLPELTLRPQSELTVAMVIAAPAAALAALPAAQTEGLEPEEAEEEQSPATRALEQVAHSGLLLPEALPVRAVAAAEQEIALARTEAMAAHMAEEAEEVPAALTKPALRE